MKTWKMALILTVMALLVAVPVMAQSDDSADSPEQIETAVTGTITGQIVNGTNGVATPGNLEVMLHVWDANFNEKDVTALPAKAGSFSGYA